VNTRLILMLLWLASLAAMGWWQRSDGRTVERTAWEQRENKQLQAANDRIIEFNAKYRNLERQSAVDMARVSADYQKELQHVQAQRDRARADLRAGKRLLDPGARPAATCGDRPADAGTAAERRDGAAPGELSGEASRFLLDLAAEADAVVVQLTACQQALVKRGPS
jgi:hypothetical protein